MKRSVDKLLQEWKKSSPRKVLLVRGARQVGKTYSIRQLGISFPHLLEVNFEEEREIKSFFSGSLNPHIICQKLSAYFSTPIIPGKTLLFFDEIQTCPEALSALRFFHEKMPELHVVATGSLLEFALSQIPSQGVGRIHSLFMYPMSFDEFLVASGEKSLCEMKQSATIDHPLDAPFHNKLIDYLKIYYLIGGMPEVVSQYLDTNNILHSQTILTNLIETLQDDFSKYKNNAPTQRLQEVLDSITLQSGGKFKYANITSSSSHLPLKEALELIVNAGLAYKIYHSSAQGIPLGAQVKPTMFKVILFDTGIFQKLLNLDIANIIKATTLDIINQGNIAELFAGLEIVKYSSAISRHKLYYWHKEKRGSNAEVDYIIQKGNEIFPIEVKSGTRGKMQSMNIFLDTHPHAKKGIRLCLENFARYNNIEVYPLYAIQNIFS